MAYSDDGSSFYTSSSTGSSRQYDSSRQTLGTGQESYHGPRGTRSRGSSSTRTSTNSRRRRSSSASGYPIKSRNINFQGKPQTRIFGLEPKMLILIALAIVLLIILVVGVTSCVRGCSSQSEETEPVEVNEIDSRVAYGVSEELTNELTPYLDQAEKLQWIAANANLYEDTDLIELALNTPEAIDFVASYPSATKSASVYGEEVTQGSVPTLYCWDTRWGYVDYAGKALALTGSGPTALSMAYIGLTGNSDKTAADIAALAEEGGYSSTNPTYLSGNFLTSLEESLGIACTSYASNSENLSYLLNIGSYLMIEVDAGTLTSAKHWVLLTGFYTNGTVRVCDPTSPDVSSTGWNATTLATSTSTLYALTAVAS